MKTQDLMIALLALLPLGAQAQEAAATVALVTGSVTASSASGTRSLSTGDRVNAGDAITVGPNSYANLRFADGGRILLRPNTEFAVESFRYTAPAEPAASVPSGAAKAQPGASPGTGSAFFRLVRGGFRAVTGLIGKADRQAYRVTTPVATIGIRGTDYEVQTCDADCPTDPARAGAQGAMVAVRDLADLQLAQAGDGSGGGLVVVTNEGRIALQTPAGEFIVDVGQVALTLPGGRTFMLPAIPDLMLIHQTPSPEACE